MKKLVYLSVFIFLVIVLPLVNASTTYTSSTDTICNDGICTKTLYSGIRNIYEDNKWVRVEEARSLKDKGFNVFVLENDLEFPIEVVDFNYTSIQVKLNPKGIKIFTEDIPIRVWKQNNTKAEQFKQDVLDGKKISKGVEDYKSEMDQVLDNEIGFNLLNQEEEKVYDFGMGYVLEFGYNSTTIVLYQNVTGIGNYDMMVESDNPDKNDSGSAGHYVGTIGPSTSNTWRAYHIFNISQLEGLIINNATFNMFYVNDFFEGIGFNQSLNQVNRDFNVDDSSWNKQPCGINYDNATACNLTRESYLEFNGTSFDDAWVLWDVSNSLFKSVNNSDWFFSFGLKNEVEDDSNLDQRVSYAGFAYFNDALMPFLNITYTAAGDSTPPYFTTTPSNEAITYNNFWSGVDFDATDETEFDSYVVNDSRFTINSTGFLNMTNILSVGIYNLNITINDTSNNLNSTVYVLTINQATPSLGISGTTPITYLTTTNVAGSNCPSQLTCSLDKPNVVYSVGVETFNHSTVGNENYTVDSITKDITINQATLSASITNDTSLTRTFDGSATTIGISESNTGDGDVTYKIYVDGIDEGSTYIQGIAGTYVIILNSTGGTNYSASSSLDSETLTINTATPSGSLAGTASINYLVTGDVEGTESNAGDGGCSYLLYRDDIQVNNPDTTVLAVDSYNYIFNTTGCTNYSASASLDTFALTVNKISATGSLSGTSSIDYLVAGDVQGTESNTGDSDVTYRLYRDGVEVSNPDTNILGVATYNYIYNTTGGENYSSTSSIDTFALTVNPIDPSSNMGLSVSSPIQYPTISDFSESETNSGDGGCSYSLNDTNRIFAAGTITFNYSTNGCANYTSGSITTTLTINKNNTLTLELDATTPITYPTVTDFAGSGCPSQLACSLNISNRIYSAGTISANYSTQGNENYTSTFTTKEVTINKATTSLGLNATTPITYGTSTDFSGSGCPTQLICNLNITNGVFSAGTISANYSTEGNENYTTDSNIFTVTINKAASLIYLYLNNIREDYGAVNDSETSKENVWINSTLEIGNGDINIYLNNTLINLGTNPLSNLTDLPMGTYYVTANYSGNENYTSGEEEWEVIISQSSNEESGSNYNECSGSTRLILDTLIVLLSLGILIFSITLFYNKGLREKIGTQLILFVFVGIILFVVLIQVIANSVTSFCGV